MRGLLEAAVRLIAVPSPIELLGGPVMLTVGLTVVTVKDDVVAVPTALSISVTWHVAL